LDQEPQEWKCEWRNVNFEFDRWIGKIKSFKRKTVRNVSDLHRRIVFEGDSWGFFLQVLGWVLEVVQVVEELLSPCLVFYSNVFAIYAF